MSSDDKASQLVPNALQQYALLKQQQYLYTTTNAIPMQWINAIKMGPPEIAAPPHPPPPPASCPVVELSPERKFSL